MKPAILLTALLLAGCAHRTPRRIHWLDEAVVKADSDRFLPNIGWLSDLELGLTEDGMLVWRKNPELGARTYRMAQSAPYVIKEVQ